MGVSGCICDKYESCRQNRRIFDLENRLAEVEAERDTLHGIRQYAVASMEARVADAVRRAEAAEARLAEVEALCDSTTTERPYLTPSEVRAAVHGLGAARGEGDRMDGEGDR